jgi:rhodanese-related sulfurtransferase
VGAEGIDKRIDVMATCIKAGFKVTDLKDLELSYAPPFSSAKDPINMIGFIAENIYRGLVSTFEWDEVNDLVAKGHYLLDVREVDEYKKSSIKGVVNIPFPEIRSRINEIPRNKTIYVFCKSGVRAYSSCRILSQNGYDVLNLSGGYKSYQCVSSEMEGISCSMDEFDFEETL